MATRQKRNSRQLLPRLNVKVDSLCLQCICFLRADAGLGLVGRARD